MANTGHVTSNERELATRIDLKEGKIWAKDPCDG